MASRYRQAPGCPRGRNRCDGLCFRFLCGSPKSPDSRSHTRTAPRRRPSFCIQGEYSTPGPGTWLKQRGFMPILYMSKDIGRRRQESRSVGSSDRYPKVVLSAARMPLKHKSPTRGDSWKESYGHKYKRIGPRQRTLADGLECDVVEIARAIILRFEDRFAGR